MAVIKTVAVNINDSSQPKAITCKVSSATTQITAAEETRYSTESHS